MIGAAYTVRDGDQITIADSRSYLIATVSAITPSAVAPGRDEIQMVTVDGEKLRLWADQSVFIEQVDPR